MLLTKSIFSVSREETLIVSGVAWPFQSFLIAHLSATVFSGPLLRLFLPDSLQVSHNRKTVIFLSRVWTKILSTAWTDTFAS